VLSGPLRAIDYLRRHDEVICRILDKSECPTAFAEERVMFHAALVRPSAVERLHLTCCTVAIVSNTCRGDAIRSQWFSAAVL
jgi:hypothetical protein